MPKSTQKKSSDEVVINVPVHFRYYVESLSILIGAGIVTVAILYASSLV